VRIVITGVKGQLGSCLLEALAGEDVTGIDLPEYDLTNPAITEAIAGLAPQLVIHGAAMTNVDGCTRDPDAAYLVNALGTQRVALACQRLGAEMVYISTNEVFGGEQERPYLEFDRPGPINVYGRSKLAGEFYVQTLPGRFYIVRTAWLYARGGNNFVRKIVRAADTRGELSVVTDEVSSPTYAPDLAAAIAALVRTGQYGIYHFANEGACSRYEFALEILRLSGRGHVPVRPITLAQYSRLSVPPPYSALRNFCGAALGITLRPWREGLQAYFTNDKCQMPN
jgi:dTDP-4-dehydrorhamnose reductase